MTEKTLKPEQLKRMEENRLHALKIRAAKQIEQNTNGKSLKLQERNGLSPNNSLSTNLTVNKPPPTLFGNKTPLCRPESSLPKIPKIQQIGFNTNKPSVTTVSIGLKSPIKGLCVVMSESRFVVEVKYHKQLIDIFKSMPTKRYDVETKNWNFELVDHNSLMEKLKPLKSEVMITPIPSNVLRIFQSSSNIPQIECDLQSLDTVLRRALMPFQVDGVCFGLRHDGRVLIADDMGLGKTIQALAIANYYQNEWPLLIAAPTSMRYAWLEAFRCWMPSLDPQQIKVLNTSKEEIGKYKVYITGYDLLTRRINEFNDIQFKVAIMDESHFLKNNKSARTKAAQQILQKTVRLILLSGTPALSRPMELYTQIQLLNKNLFPNYVEFGKRYCNGHMTTWGWNFSGATNTQELLLIMENKFMIRRLKADVLKQIPPKLRNVVLLDPNDIEHQGNQMKELAVNLTKTSLKGMERRGELLRYFNLTSRAKMKAVSNYISDLLEKNQKLICFAHHQVMLDAICFAVSKKKHKYIRIDGSTSSEMRKKLCDDFQLDDSISIAILSITAANAGITLTAAKLVVFAELFWNPGILTQAEDRAHRIGQQDSVVVQYLVATGTADDYLWSLVQNKLEVLNKVGLSKDSFSNADTTTLQKSDQLLLDEFLLSGEDFKSTNICEESPKKKTKIA